MIVNNKFLFRFLFIFLLLSIFPFPFNAIPGCSSITEIVQEVYSPIIIWIGKKLFTLEYEISTGPTGSGDMTFNYLLNGFFLTLAFIGAAIWAFLARKKENDENLNRFLVILLRYYLAYFMLSYGFYKVFPLQFPEPSFARLLQPYGESSPMGLAWTFLGYSSEYSLFAGMGEVIGGLLLLHRRTAVLGSLIVMAVMTNVFVMNMCFDIPVKLFSFQLLFISFLIALPSIKRILDAILLNRPVEPLVFNAYFSSPRWNLGQLILKWGTVFCFLFSHFSEARNLQIEYGSEADELPLYGLYETVSFVENGDTLPPLITDKQRWKYLIIEYKEMAQIMGMDGSIQYLKMKIDEDSETIQLSTRSSTPVADLHYEITDSKMLIEGKFQEDSIVCTTKIIQKSDFLLMNRGFRWINEYPYNR